jgi:hypothetical protein
VIFGWDRVCDRSLDWKREMGVDKLPNGGEQVRCVMCAAYASSAGVWAVSQIQPNPNAPCASEVICGGRRWWQPFYWVLPDEGDCVALFGDKRHR